MTNNEIKLQVNKILSLDEKQLHEYLCRFRLYPDARTIFTSLIRSHPCSHLYAVKQKELEQKRMAEEAKLKIAEKLGITDDELKALLNTLK